MSHNDESAAKITPLPPRTTKMLEELLSKIIPWEKITTVSLQDFPYYIDQHAKTLLMECVASHLKQSNLSKFHRSLASSSDRILLRSAPGSELYRERLVSAIAVELRVPLLKLDNLSFEEEEDESDGKEEDRGGKKEDSEREDDDSNEKDDNSDGEEDRIAAFAKLLKNFNSEKDDNDDWEEDDIAAFEKLINNLPSEKGDGEEDDSDSDEDDSNAKTDDKVSPLKNEDGEEDDSLAKADEKVSPLKNGDRVKYIGNAIPIKEVNNRTLSYGQRGEVCEVNDERVAVAFNISGLQAKEAEKDEKSTEIFQQTLVTWLDVKDVQKVLDTQTHDFCIAVEVLCGVLASQQPVIVYFPDSFSWPSMSNLTEKEKDILNRFQEGVVMICAQNKGKSVSEEIDKCLECMKKCTWWSFRIPPVQRVPDIDKIFSNLICLKPPKDQDLLNTFKKQIEEDMSRMISEGNLSAMQRVLKTHNLSCTSLEHANVGDMILTQKKVEKVVGWARNQYLSSCPHPCVIEEKLHIPHQSIKLAILRLKEEETPSKKQSKSIKDLSKDRHEKSLTSAVIRSEDIGVTFDDVGALENVKKVLYETVILPMRRPELFSHGNLLTPCKGILLFGPPGTGKTLVAKALATESGANFINISTATITSKFHGETENLTGALFSYASKLAPVIIFVDEADGLLGVRDHNNDTTSRLNEFMTGWDGLTSKASQRILVICATNRPYDLDEAIIRRMPRRIYVGLPDTENRSKILKILLKNENLEPGFSFEQLAEATAGYSGSDLKNLCVAAAYRPIEELLEQESKLEGEKSEADPAARPRPLKLNDFTHCRAKVRPSVSISSRSIMKLKKWNEQYGERDGQDSI